MATVEYRSNRFPKSSFASYPISIPALAAAYQAYCSGLLRTDDEARFFIQSWVGAQDTPLDAAKLIIETFVEKQDHESSDDSFQWRCRCCARLVSVIESTAEAVNEHPAYRAAIYAVQRFHPYLFKEILTRLLLGPYGRKVANKADLFTQLALAFDFLGFRKRSEALLRNVQIMSRSGAVQAATADFSLRLLSAICALTDRFEQVFFLNAEAEPYAETVYGLSPLQVDIAWTLAVCGTGMVAEAAPPTLFEITVHALRHIEKRNKASEDLTNVDMLMHGLDRSRRPGLSSLSCITTLRILREAPPEDLDDADLAMTFVNTGNAVLRNIALTSNWNLVARHFFTELIRLVDSGEINRSPKVQYQVALANAGIGYSYTNIASATEGIEQVDLYEKAREHLDAAIELLKHFHDDNWIETSVWAVSGHVEAACGRIQKMHQRFAAALLAGAKYYQLDVEDLVHFFSPDYDTRLKYSEALVTTGEFHTAILLAKAAVSAIHHHAAPSEEVAEFAQAYISTRTLAHRTLINELSQVGRYNEGELAYDLLKQNEYNEFTRRSYSREQVAQYVALTPFELEAIRESGLSEATVNAKQMEHRETTVKLLAQSFSGLNEALKERIRSRHQPDDLESRQNRIDPSTHLRETEAILRFVASGSAVSIAFSSSKIKKQLVVPFDERVLGPLIFSFRQQCRLPTSELQSVQVLGHELYRILLSPITDYIDNNISHLYIETDRTLANVPFAALHDGVNYLIQRFSLIYLNRGALSIVPKSNVVETEHAAIFACTDAPGEELPGAGQEIKIIGNQLGRMSRLTVDCYVDEKCAAEAFVREIIRPRGGKGLIHLATHANFNPSSDISSGLMFHDEVLSIRDLRTELEKSGCDTGLFVLSACGTARQDIDVEGFSSVLLRSGVRTILPTLWETFDDSAPEFFRLFYADIRDLSSASSAASAVRAAQLAFLTSSSEFAHPAHWAPYIVVSAQVS
ncbi:hypothetical protein hmeg3_09655 [Herbaspirillum sp. meg3]|uniref:CHAT domain-containing protein n=1 Tax=Herbaspirillum sp. meg3 TaxID=2025949 RepID=UPI000B98D6D8|nr:CHAT domain-containing protein [Herbaspirillum sp. meg3]ASU38536.1 hypothetical protein hmeg3_09655 [Herbaspirillum sp. meg3]